MYNSVNDIILNGNIPLSDKVLSAQQQEIFVAFANFMASVHQIALDATADITEKEDRFHRMKEILLGDFSSAADAPARILLDKSVEYGFALKHPLHILQAYQRAIVQHRYRTWSDVLLFCQYATAPVGRFVVDILRFPPQHERFAEALAIALFLLGQHQQIAGIYAQKGWLFLPENWLRMQKLTPDMVLAKSISASMKEVDAQYIAKCRQLLQEAAPLARIISKKAWRQEIFFLIAAAEKMAEKLQNRRSFQELPLLSKRDIFLLRLKAYFLWQRKKKKH